MLLLTILGSIWEKLALIGRPEVWILGFTSVFLFSCVWKIEPWWTVYCRMKLFAGNAVLGVEKLIAEQKFSPAEADFSTAKMHQEEEVEGKSWSVRKGAVAVFALQGRRKKMEDRFSILIENEHTGTTICGIFDGHGGEFAADFVEKTLFKSIMVRILKSALANVEEDYKEILKDSILNLDEQLLSIASTMTGPTGGTTCLVSLIHDNRLFVANVGDSRSVICDKNGEAVALTEDHKPQQLNERRRIKEAGGFISFHGVWRVGGVLATSRALGDFVLKEKNLIIADPDVEEFNLTELSPRFLIMATDGLWDCISNQDAVDFLKDKIEDPLLGAKALVQLVYKQGAIDNITVLVVNFEDLKLGSASSADVETNHDSRNNLQPNSDQPQNQDLKTQRLK